MMRTTRILAAGVSWVALSGCGGPQSGNYVFTLVSEGGDCNFDPAKVQTPPFENGAKQTIDVSGDEVIFRGGGDYQCPLDGNHFECDVMAEDQAGLLCTVHVKIHFKGTFDSDTSLTLNIAMPLTCDGTGCEATGHLAYGSDFTFPCSKTWDFTAELE